MIKYQRVYAQINLDAIAYNMEQMKRNIHEGTEMIAVIKTDGYGHGAIPIANLVEPYSYVWGFATASLEEALILKKAGISKPILVLGSVFPQQYEELIEYEIRANVYTKEMAEELSRTAVNMGKKAYCHIKIDTGMGRLGFLVNEQSVDAITAISKLPNLMLEGMFTHFSKADEEDKKFTEIQHDQFVWMEQHLQERGVKFPFVHCDNSAGIIDLQNYNHNLVRAGISIYGLYPSKEVDKSAVDLKPALELISQVTFVKTLKKGSPISYGGTYITDSDMQVATIPVGYGDGYPRSLSNKGYVLIHGQKAKILGRVCMDQFMVDVTDIEDVTIGDRVVLIGKDHDTFLPVETLSDLSGRFNYEFVCDLGKRIPRVYQKDGKVTEAIDYFIVPSGHCKA
ncbi:MAG: alanine racemase [Hespellia sp.]|nr:alanine racemase [Hespellia sp.]